MRQIIKVDLETTEEFDYQEVAELFKGCGAHKINSVETSVEDIDELK